MSPVKTKTETRKWYSISAEPSPSYQWLEIKSQPTRTQKIGNKLYYVYEDGNVPFDDAIANDSRESIFRALSLTPGESAYLTVQVEE